MKIKVSGTAQYGVPNFTLQNTEGNKEKYEMPSKDGNPELLELACLERIEQVESLLDLAQQIFFEVYIEDKESELELGNLDNIQLEYICEMLVDEGLANSEEEAEEIFDDDEIQSFINSWAFSRDKDHYEMTHKDEFWDFEEAQSIYHYFSD